MNGDIFYVLMILFIGFIILFALSYDSGNMALAYASIIGFVTVLIVSYIFSLSKGGGLGSS